MHKPTSPLHPAHPTQGFTLIELMVTLTLAAILLAVAIPGFTNQLQGWQRDSATQAFTSHIRLARTEAIRTSRRVVMCTSADGSSCAKDTVWQTGWIVFVDVDGNDALNTGDHVLATRGVSSGLRSMQTNGNVQRLVFMPNGLMASNATTLEVIPTGSAVRTNEVTVNRVGRAYVTSADQKKT
ncbi:GspH/FimT family pseudopilin [Hydrogenophaga sp. BPS33]|uniref:GspH/FimT family pseudopilin n=1 Tax=Hydrogenophaga sp. BPS33 TaxID=2651974 RepID=UPI001320183C|nr:GspH/FimT family pseudopilin [Hydrogenophaga sp. BPS33]QHE88941.1 prepilin-type N-terminal cleavage/methylation domain-containing protein [Hydrogenophaga sp. BPS33]